MEFTNLQYEGINIGACGQFDVQFLKIAAVKWQELEDAVLRGKVRRCGDTFPPSPYTPPQE